ncbi:MAG: hypothetical protein K2M76_01230, partial [Muribaculaceae bacterium]|nr:hypothetical protein [Muribaculaceae bacterium]
MKTRLIILMVLSLAAGLGAADAYPDTIADNDKMATGTQFQIYPITDDSMAPALTPTPEGYEPFHM